VSEKDKEKDEQGLTGNLYGVRFAPKYDAWFNDLVERGEFKTPTEAVRGIIEMVYDWFTLPSDMGNLVNSFIVGIMRQPPRLALHFFLETSFALASVSDRKQIMDYLFDQLRGYGVSMAESDPSRFAEMGKALISAKKEYEQFAESPNIEVFKILSLGQQMASTPVPSSQEKASECADNTTRFHVPSREKKKETRRRVRDWSQRNRNGRKAVEG